MAAAKKAPNPIDKHVGSRVRMRRMMLAMSQEKLGDALGLTFQQVQKYEKGTNRIGASRLQQISHILQVPVAFFFEGAPNLHGSTEGMKEAPSPAYVSDFLATSEGLSLTKAFMRIKEAKLRRRIVDLVEEIAGRVVSRCPLRILSSHLAHTLTPFGDAARNTPRSTVVPAAVDPARGAFSVTLQLSLYQRIRI
jgi:transcriptional regulator with XRE-family HTH domain